MCVLGRAMNFFWPQSRGGDAPLAPRGSAADNSQSWLRAAAVRQWCCCDARRRSRGAWRRRFDLAEYWSTTDRRQSRVASVLWRRWPDSRETSALALAVPMNSCRPPSQSLTQRTTSSHIKWKTRSQATPTLRAALAVSKRRSENIFAISNWLNLGRPAPREGGLRRGENFWLRLTTASAQCLRLSERFFHCNKNVPVAKLKIFPIPSPSPVKIRTPVLQVCWRQTERQTDKQRPEMHYASNSARTEQHL